MFWAPKQTHVLLTVGLGPRPIFLALLSRLESAILDQLNSASSIAGHYLHFILYYSILEITCISIQTR